jgi:RNA polymerase sigma-70 factor, ECF subfamily
MGFSAAPADGTMNDEQPRVDIALTGGPTLALIRRARGGDDTAKTALLKRFQPLLLRWAHGRLPLIVRDMNDTVDFVQIALIKALNKLEAFESDRPGSFLIYLRQILLNQVRDEVRRRRVRPRTVEFEEGIANDENEQTHVERIIGAERLSAYQAAVGKLPKRQQELVIMRLEFGMSYPEIAAEAESTPDAVRVMVTRAVAKIAVELEHVRE